MVKSTKVTSKSASSNVAGNPLTYGAATKQQGEEMIMSKLLHFNHKHSIIESITTNFINFTIVIK